MTKKHLQTLRKGIAIVVITLFCLGVVNKKETKTYKIVSDIFFEDFYSGNSSYVRLNETLYVVRFSNQSDTLMALTLSNNSEHDYELYYDTLSSNPQIYVTNGMEEDPIRQYIKYEGYPAIEVASFRADGADYEYSFSKIDDEKVCWYFVTAYYYLDTVADTILNIPPHEDTIMKCHYWKDLIVQH